MELENDMTTQLTSLDDDAVRLKKPIPITVEGNYQDGFRAEFMQASQVAGGDCMQAAVDQLKQNIVVNFLRWDRMDADGMSIQSLFNMVALREYIELVEVEAT